MTAERQKIRAAEWLYRWNLSSSIIGILFTVLTFLGVFTLALGPIFTERFGLSYVATAFLLLLFVLAVIIGFGVYLDKVIHFWSAQATVGTVRNPYLVSLLYQKELLSLVYVQQPMLKTLRVLVEAQAMTPGAKQSLLDDLDRSLSKVDQSIRDKRWPIEPHERVYCSSRRCSFGEDLPVADFEDPMGDVRNTRIMRHHQDRLLVLLVQTAKEIEDLLSRLRVELARGFVRQEERRVVCEGNRDRDPLLFAAAQFVRSMDGPLGHPDEFQEFLPPFVPDGGSLRRESHRELDVLLRGEGRDEVEELEDETDALEAIPDQVRVAQVDQIRSVHLNTPRRGAVDSANEVQQGGLAAARWTLDRDEFAVGDLHVEASKGDDFGLSRPVDLDDVLRGDVRHFNLLGA